MIAVLVRALDQTFKPRIGGFGICGGDPQG
jgi:hypothetical protein